MTCSCGSHDQVALPVRLDGFGFPVVALAETVAAVASAVGAVKSTKKPKVQAPVQPVAPPSLFDAFGVQNHDLVKYGLLGLGAVVLLKAVR